MSKHNHTTHTGSSPTYKSWHMMKQRCNNANYSQYKDYGARGIRVCARWDSFENFLADMGVRPEGMTLDRKDTNGDYTPENCKWSTRKEQQRNRRTNNVLVLDGRAMILVDWAAELDLTPHALLGRLSRGWSLRKALTTPAAQRGRRKKGDT
jgi:hypothetical protein